MHQLLQRGAPAPLPHCGRLPVGGRVVHGFATRGAGAPPSLRCPRSRPGGGRNRLNEGRRRPSLIAVYFRWVSRPTNGAQRGAPAPLPHCGWLQAGGAVAVGVQRGAPAPLPHCGTFADGMVYIGCTQRGAPAPLPHCGRLAGAGRVMVVVQRGAPAPLPHCGRPSAGFSVGGRRTTRGAGAPPSLRLPVRRR